jgi:hypothetical protein
MASTYSTNLKIELMALGDQAGTWGTTTNTNFGTSTGLPSGLEQAIVGYGNPDFTTDADLTISLTNSNATQVARSFALNVTSSGSLTATRNLIVDTIQKPYLIYNNTTGSQSIVVKTSAGTGITVPNGARTLVYVDGTNVVSQVTQLPALTLATALPVTSGGTGAAALTANNVLLGNGTSAVQFVVPGASGNVLTSNGTTWSSAAIIPSGTVMLFVQTSAPTGWTKSVAYNDRALRVVSGTAGTGGSVAFATAFASQGVSGTVGNHTLTTAEIPSHTHTTPTGLSGSNGSEFATSKAGSGTASVSGSTGGGGSHNHAFTGTAINLAVTYIDVIIATKS